MSMSGAGTHLISSAQTWVDGVAPEPGLVVSEGATWRWFGTALRVDGSQSSLLLGNGIGLAELHARAAKVVRKLARTHGMDLLPSGQHEQEPFEGGFIVSDGARFYPVMPLRAATEELLVFVGDIPPVNQSLIVVKVAEQRSSPQQTRGVICFTPGTGIATPDGPVAVEDLYPGDKVLTKDNGPQEILWMGLRQVTGARMHALGGLRPIRIRAGALGGDQPQPDLLVSPEHRVLLTGRKAEMLFNTPEVLVRAVDLVDDRKVIVDHAATEVVYIHLLLANHEVIWANGVETESFHPASADLGHLNSAELEELLEIRPDVDQDPLAYGPHARRCLTAAELAILRHEAPPHYLA